MLASMMANMCKGKDSTPAKPTDFIKQTRLEAKKAKTVSFEEVKDMFKNLGGEEDA